MRRRMQSPPARRPPYAMTVSRRSRRHGSRRRAWGVPTLGLAVLGLSIAVILAVNSNGTVSGHHDARRAAAGSPDPVASPRAARHHSAPSPAFAPRRAVDRVLRYTPFVARGTGRRRVIALTFDDGPSPYTEQIVRILLRMHAPATFFVVGQQLTYFSAGLRDELRHGFEVGDHTENHAWLIRLSGAGQYAQIHEAAAGIERLGGSVPRLFRPPYGVYDAHTLSTLRRLRMLMVMWSIDPGDWRRPGAGAIAQRVLAAAHPGGIVEMHDGGGDRSETAAALPAIITGLRRRHYQLVTVGRLLVEDPPPRRQTLPHPASA